MTKGVAVWFKVRGYQLVLGFIARNCLVAIAFMLGVTAGTDRSLAQANQSSPLGANLNAVSYFTSEQPFLNILKTASAWSVSSGSESSFYSSLDANGYPPSLAGYGSVYTTVLRNLNGTWGGYYYPAGTYVFLYDGAGTFNFTGDATVASSAPGRIILNVAAPTAVGITLYLTSTGSGGTYATNFRLVYSPDSTPSTVGTREALLNSGEMFNPDFISRLSSVRALRFMDWMGTNGSYQKNWSDRPLPNWAFWNDPIKFNNGSFDNLGIVPIEVMVALCNKVNADCWFNMPPLATDDYVAQFASLVHSQLNQNLKVYVEYANELWNQSFPPALSSAIAALGWSTFPATNGDVWNGVFAYGLLRAVQDGATWKSVWGADASRVIRVVGGQSGYDGRNQFILAFTAGQAGGDPTKFSGTLASNVDAFAVAPYFGYTVPDTFSLDQLFAEMLTGGLVSGGYTGGMVKQATDWMLQNAVLAKSYGLQLVGYEGGQTLVDYSGHDTALQQLYLAANRDPRMGTAYATFLNGWKAAGGNLLNTYNQIGSYSIWGYWGALENVIQTSSPKFDAIANFAANNPCWWSNCATTSTSTLSYTGTTSGTSTTSSTSTSSTTSTGTTSPSSGTTSTSSGTTSTSTGTTSTTSSSSGTTSTSGGSSSTTSSPSAPPPTIAIQSPTNGTVLKGNGTLNIAVSANSSIGVQSIRILADGNLVATCSSTSYCSTSWQGKSIPPGTHTVTAIAVDQSGTSGRNSTAFTALR